MKKGIGTSLPEQVLFYYIHSFFPDAVNRYKIPIEQRPIEIDIYVDSLKIGVEYDGRYWHKNKAKRDNEKNTLLNSKGIFVLRLRETKLPVLEPFTGEPIEIRRAHHLEYGNCEDWEFEFIEIAVNYLLKIAVKLDANRSIPRFKLTQERYKADLPKIYGQLYANAVWPNHADYCAIKLWNTNQNYPLTPEKIPKDDWAYCTFTCPNGKVIVLPRYFKNFKSDCSREGVSCKNCYYGLFCPFLRYCTRKDENIPVKCKYMEDKILNAILNGKVYSEKYNGHTTFDKWLFNESKIGLQLMEMYISKECTPSIRINILKFLHLYYEGPQIQLFTSYNAYTKHDIEVLMAFRSKIKGVEIRIHDKTDPHEVSSYI